MFIHKHTCSWHFYLLERNNYTLGDISHDECRCAYAIGWLNATNKTARYYVRDTFVWWNLGDVSHDKCRCALAIRWLNATNKISRYIYNWHLCLLEKSNSSLNGIPADKRRCAYAIGSPNATNIAFRYQCVTCYWWAASIGPAVGTPRLAGARVKSGGALGALRDQAQIPHWVQDQLPIGCA